MKNTILFLFAVLLLLGFNTSYAQTNTVITGPAMATNTATHWPKEFTIGGSGVTNPKTRDTQFGLDATFAVQPLSLPIWFGINQELSWSPNLVGATDLSADYAWPLITNKLYLNTGWSAGATYDTSTLGWRTGPEASLEYYTVGNAFIIAGLNYDLVTRDSGGWNTANGNVFRYFIGVGVAW